MTFEEYSRHFASVSDARLLDTIDNPEDSDPLAVEVARVELQKRDLSTEYIGELRSAAALRKAKNSARNESIRARKSRILGGAQELFVDTGRMERGKRWRLWLVLALLLPLFLTLPRLIDLPSVISGQWPVDLYSLEHFLPLLWLPLTMWLLWKQHRAGWFMGSAFSAFLLSGALLNAGIVLKYSGLFDDDAYGEEEPYISQYDWLMENTGSMEYPVHDTTGTNEVEYTVLPDLSAIDDLDTGSAFDSVAEGTTSYNVSTGDETMLTVEQGSDVSCNDSSAVDPNKVAPKMYIEMHDGEGLVDLLESMSPERDLFLAAVGVLWTAGLFVMFMLRRSLREFNITARERWLTVGSILGLYVLLWVSVFQ